jgi:hypothetical protein
LRTFAGVYETYDCAAILSRGQRGCRELQDVTHFHLELFGKYISGLCSGLPIRRDDLGTAITAEKYPLLARLYETGLHGLFEVAGNRALRRPGVTFPSAISAWISDVTWSWNGSSCFRNWGPRAFYENL